MSADALSRADAHHAKASALYREYLLAASRKAGSVANLAARAGVPVVQVHKALDTRCDYRTRRNLAHEIQRKLAARGAKGGKQ